MNRLLRSALALVAFALSTIGSAAELQAGKDYTLIDPPLAGSASTGKIEVIEFFSYGCPHCNDFHPLISTWAGKLPKDISLRKVPVSFGRPAWARLAGIYYTLQATGDLNHLDAAVFKAIHVDRVNFNSDESVARWAGEKGADAKKVGDAIASFGMQSQVRRGDQEAQSAKIGGVPALVVGGRYLVNNAAASSYEDLLRITDALIAKARNERTGK